ncbi:polysaccharide deacetylase family protein [Streptomyces sp. NPDC085932]|uniref:polysaccharide deacetylase family protein n=1 Tax=Streptomyces sp. NPDC085932 TaxID=3365741 RepID=UPI0037D636AE
MRSRWGAAGHQAAVGVTFDNLGEAAELELGLWPKGKPVGSHHSVTRELPELLKLLEAHDLKTTFFVEGWNADNYPEAVKTIAAAGHEVGCHGYRHELWHTLAPEREREALSQAIAAMDGIGIQMSGIRPPGGLLNAQTSTLMRRHNLRYVSTAGGCASVQDGIARLPFEWHTIDGAYHLPQFAHTRRPPGTGSLSPEEMLIAFRGVVEETIRDGGYVAFVFHIMWLDLPERRAALAQLIDELRSDARIWLAPCRDISDWMLAHADQFPPPPGDESTSSSPLSNVASAQVPPGTQSA